METKKKIKLQHGFMFDTTKVRGFDVDEGVVLLAFYGRLVESSTVKYDRYNFFELFGSQPVKFSTLPFVDKESFDDFCSRALDSGYREVEFV